MRVSGAPATGAAAKRSAASWPAVNADAIRKRSSPCRSAAGWPRQRCCGDQTPRHRKAEPIRALLPRHVTRKRRPPKAGPRGETRPATKRPTMTSPKAPNWPISFQNLKLFVKICVFNLIELKLIESSFTFEFFNFIFLPGRLRWDSTHDLSLELSIFKGFIYANRMQIRTSTFGCFGWTALSRENQSN